MELKQAQTSGRIRLKGHEPLSQTTIHGWPAMLFGLLFVVMGFPVLSIGTGWMDYTISSIHAPLWVIGVGGGMFMACGMWLMLHGFNGLRRMWNMTNGKRQLPNSPWLWDYDWRAQGSTDNILKKALSTLVGLLVFGIFLAPFNWIAFVSEHGFGFWQILVGFFDCVIMLGVGGRFITKLKQYLTIGNSTLGYNDFPFYLGRTMSVTLKSVPSEVTNLQLDLRCIEEAYEVHGSGEHKKSEVVCYEVYKDSQIIQQENIQSGGDLHLSWNLPNDKALSSTPSERPAKFWELEVKADRGDSTYHNRFVLPIYAPMSQ